MTFRLYWEWSFGNADMVVTLAARKSLALAVLEEKLKVIRTELQAYARRGHGKFVLFGSAARGDVRPGSDLDVVVDFAPSARSAAVEFVERACITADIPYDIYLADEVSPALAERVARDGVVLQ